MGIYIWGIGCGASEAIENGLNPSIAEAFVDSNPSCSSFMGRPVIRPEELRGREIALIIVTSRMADEIGACCRSLGINESRILFLKDYCSLKDRNAGCLAAQELLGKELLSSLMHEQRIISVPSVLENSALKSSNDFVRTGTLELISRRIKPIPGAMAELGVYRGGFARCMNSLMPERKLYLFDTFSGFDAEEARSEEARNTCGSAFLQAHRNTDAEAVLKIMPNPESVIIKAGLFPASLEGLEESFALVSLDADFRDSSLEGLRYFWPRISPGGYLMLHDWGSRKLKGVAEALEIYEEEIGERLPGVPLPDLGNSLIMQKI